MCKTWKLKSQRTRTWMPKSKKTKVNVKKRKWKVKGRGPGRPWFKKWKWTYKSEKKLKGRGGKNWKWTWKSKRSRTWTPTMRRRPSQQGCPEQSEHCFTLTPQVRESPGLPAHVLQPSTPWLVTLGSSCPAGSCTWAAGLQIPWLNVCLCKKRCGVNIKFLIPVELLVLGISRTNLILSFLLLYRKKVL